MTYIPTMIRRRDRNLTKQELQEYFWAKKNIERLQNELLELETQATRQTAQLTWERKSQNYDPNQLSNIIVKIVELQEEINRQLQKSYELVAKIERAIEKLPEREKYLIRARYIDCKSWEQIAVDMNYSWQHVHRLHSKALKLLAS